MDGVVFDSESLWKKGFIECNKIYGVSLSEEFRQSICGKSEKLIRDEIRVLEPNLDVDKYRDHMIEMVNEDIKAGNFTVKDNFLEIVDYLKGKGYKIALATSSFKSRAMDMFKKKGLNLEEIFDAASFLEDVGANSKPNPYIFKITADKLNVKYDECVVLEDSINGIHAAVNGGMIPVHVLDIIKPDEFCKEHCYRLIENLGELKGII